MPATLWAIFAGLVTFAFLLSLLAFFLWLYDRALAVIMSVCYPLILSSSFGPSRECSR